jgi:hypothetical protein
MPRRAYSRPAESQPSPPDGPTQLSRGPFIRRNRVLIALFSVGALALVYAIYTIADVVSSPASTAAADAGRAIDGSDSPGSSVASASPGVSTTPSALASSTAGPTATPKPAVKPNNAPPAGSGVLAGAWPNPGNTGVPAGWKPASTRTTNLEVRTAGTVVQDIRLVNADIIVTAKNVTIRRVEIEGGGIFNNGTGSNCAGLLIEDVSIVKAPGQVTTFSDGYVVGPGGYTARRLKVDGLAEGLRVSDKDRCGPVLVERSFVRIAAPDSCSGDWHGDGIQGYYGAALTVRNSTVDMTGTSKSCDGTSPFFYPDQGNTRADVDGLLVKGGLYLGFRLETAGSVRNLMMVRGTGLDVGCANLSVWSASEVTADANYQPTVLRALSCP